MSVAHVLLLAPGAEGRRGDVAGVLSDLAAIAARHGGGALHVGANHAPGQFTDGLRHGLLAVFPDPAALAAYLEDDEHHEVVGRMGAHGMRAVVADLAPAEPPAHSSTSCPQ